MVPLVRAAVPRKAREFLAAMVRDSWTTEEKKNNLDKNVSIAPKGGVQKKKKSKLVSIKNQIRSVERLLAKVRKFLRF